MKCSITQSSSAPIKVIVVGRLFVSLLLLGTITVLSSASIAHAGESSGGKAAVQTALLSYHFKLDETFRNELEVRAGGRDAFIKALLELRLDPNSPFIPTRAEKILISYASDQRVAEALLEDYSHPERKGLARIIRANMQHLPIELQQALNKKQ